MEENQIGYTWSSTPGICLQVFRGRNEDEIELRVIRDGNTPPVELSRVRINRDALTQLLNGKPVTS